MLFACNGPQKQPRASIRQYKCVEAYAIPGQESKTVADVLIKKIISRFEVPLELHSDKGRTFESELFCNFCENLGIRKTRTTVLHPQFDRMVERINRTIGKYLSKAEPNHQRNWDQHISFFLMAYRSAVNESTGQALARILFGKEMKLACDLVFGCKPGEDYVTERRRRTEEQENYYGEKYLVWLYAPQKRRGLSRKQQNAWEGPYRIRKISNDKPWVVRFNGLSPLKGDHNDDVQDAPQIKVQEMSLPLKNL